MDEGADRNEVVQWYVNRGLRQPPAESSETPEIDAEAEKAAILARVGAKVAKRRAEGATETNGEQQKTFVPSLYQQAIFEWVAGGYSRSA